MLVYERDQYAEAHKRGPGWGLWLAWVSANAVGGMLSLAFGSVAEDSLAGKDGAGLVALVVAGIMAGVMLGVAQGLVLLRYLKWRGFGLWVLVTTTGRTARWLLSPMVAALLSLPFYDSGRAGRLLWLFVICTVGALSGLALGLFQMYALRGLVRRPGWWLWANVGAYAFAWLAAYLVTQSNWADWGYWAPYWDSVNRELGPSPLSVGLITGLVFGALTGIALVDLLRHPGPRAAWSLASRPERHAILPGER